MSPDTIPQKHADRIKTLQDEMEAAMRNLEGWQYPLEIQVAMQPIYHAWALLHSLVVHAYYESKLIDDGLATITVPKDQAAIVAAERKGA